jgi:hypothetical protein
LLLVGRDKLDRTWGLHLPRSKDCGGFGAQTSVLDQFQPQERSENAERIAPQRLVVDRPERSRVDRNASDREIIIADRMHPHDREDAADRDELLRGSETNGAMAFDAQATPLASPLEARP